MKELIKVRCKSLHIKADEEYLYCEAKDEYEFKISIELIYDVVKCVYSKIQEHKKSSKKIASLTVNTKSEA